MTAKLARVWSVEYHISKPITSVTMMHPRTIQEWTLSQVRWVVKVSPGNEAMKVRKTKPALNRAPSCISISSNFAKEMLVRRLTVEGRMCE